jgi:hypothetical protein
MLHNKLLPKYAFLAELQISEKLHHLLTKKSGELTRCKVLLLNSSFTYQIQTFKEYLYFRASLKIYNCGISGQLTARTLFSVMKAQEICM